MPSFHIYIHYKQKEKDTLDYPNDVNFSREEVEEKVKKYENGDDFILGGFTIHSDPAHIKKFEIWETPNELPPPVDWNNMWRIAKLVTRKFTTSIPGAHGRVLRAKKEIERETQKSREERDLFICHATEDKEEVVRPLVKALVNSGFSVWYDEFALKLGDPLRKSIEKGLAQSKYGLAILSPNFFTKKWPQKELEGLTAKEHAGRQVILPVWHNVDEKYLIEKAPMLAGIYAVSTEKGIDYIVKEVRKVVKPSLVQPKRSKNAIKESTKSRLRRIIDLLRGRSGTQIVQSVKHTESDRLKHMFLEVLDGVALFDLADSQNNRGVFNFIESAILERNRPEGADLFRALLDWFFGTVTPNCRYSILEMFARLTKLSHLKRVISNTKRTSSFVAEFGASDSYEIAGVNAEILQNIQSFLSVTDCRKIVNFVSSNDQILCSWRANRYLQKVLSSCERKVDPETRTRIEELYEILAEEM